ncbi:hypothetical protein [Nocardioides sp.]|uniref:hypothetical protein n=1 Tax=Nocardioides sp. TaxID=35761 RepID=UPI00356A2555
MPFPAVFTAASMTFILLVPALMIAAMVLAARHRELVARREVRANPNPLHPEPISAGAQARHLRAVA